MKVALLAENYFPTLGGIQEHIHHLALSLLSYGHEVRVLTGSPGACCWKGPRDQDWVMRLGRARLYNALGSRTTVTFGPTVARNLYRALRQEKFDVVHVHGPCDFGLPSLLYQMYRGPLVATLHSPMNCSSPLRRLAAPYYRYVLNRTDAVIAVSEAARNAMSRFASFESRIIPNGVDTAALSMQQPLPQFHDGMINVLMLGRLEPRNGPDIMFAALPRLLARFPKMRLLVAGEGRDGIASHQAMVPAFARDRVVFLGAVYEERARLYASAQVCVVPARSGTFSIIVLEALAAGVPVVATPFVEGWQNEPHFGPVKVCADFSPDALAAGIEATLEQDCASRIAGGRKIAAALDWARVGRRVEGVYGEVLDEASRRSGALVARNAPPLASTDEWATNANWRPDQGDAASS